MKENVSRLIGVFSTKGGVGKTVLAANTAIAIFKQTQKPTILVDLDIHYGRDMAKMLNLSPGKTMVDLISRLKKESKKPLNLKDYVTAHSSGIDFLPAIPRPRYSHLIDVESLHKAYSLLRQYYAYIIVDTGKSFTEPLIATFDSANLVLLVLTPDIISVYQTQWNIETLQSLHFPIKMVRIVLNRSESKGAVGRQEVGAALPCEIIAHIPSVGKVVGPSVNQGVPFVISYERSRVAEAVKKLAENLVTNQELYTAQQKTLRLKLTEKVTGKETFWEEHGIAATYTTREITEEDEIISLKKQIHSRLIEELDLKKVDIVSLSSQPQKAKDLREKTGKIISKLLAEQAGGIISSYEVRNTLVKEITDEALGLGPLEELMRDPEITDILVNNKDQIYIERRGKLELTNKKFISNTQIRTVIERIISPLGRRIDESVPMVDARLPDGSRVNAIIPPLSLAGPMLSIRKFARERYSIEDLLRFGTLNENMAKFLEVCVVGRRNMIVSGGTGSGKTTLLNVLSHYIPSTERILTIEDAAELQLHQEHWGRLESRLPNIEGKGEVGVRDLFRNSLRMRPDRIIVGECRGNEALDMLQAMNTGHDGSLSTIHANSTHDVIARLDSMILMSGIDLPVRAVREMVASAVDLIIHTARLSDGSRKILCITEIAGLESTDRIRMKDIYSFKQTGIEKDGRIKGTYEFTGHKPTFLEKVRFYDIELPPELQT